VVPVAIFVVAALVIYVSYGMRVMRYSAVERWTALESLVGAFVRLGLSAGKGLIVEEEGTVKSVDAKHVVLTRLNGTDESIDLARIRWINDDRFGHRGDW
jgi:hypothetical protein